MTLRSPSRPQHRSHWLHLLLGLVVSAICLWFAVRGLLHEPDALTKAWTAFARADYRTVLPIAVATGVFYWFKARRWRLLLKPLGNFRATRDLFPLVMIGFAFNNLLPVHLGEVIRVMLFAKRQRMKLTPVITTVALERLFDSVAVLSLLAYGLAFVPGLDPSIRQSTLILAGCIGGLVAVVLLFVFWTRPMIHALNAVLGPILPRKLGAKLTSFLETMVDGLAALRHPRLFAGILAFSFGNWLVNASVIYMALWSFDLPRSLEISCIVLGLTAVGAAVPSAPGYFGVIQLCFMSVLKVFTDDDASVLAASIYYHLIEYVLVTIVGLYYFNTTGLTLAEVEGEAEAELEAETRLQDA